MKSFYIHFPIWTHQLVMFQAVYDQLLEADTHTRNAAYILSHLRIRHVACGVAAFAVTLTGNMTDLSNVVDVMTLMTPPPSPAGSMYVPSRVGESFRYTDLPGSGCMYNAQVVAIRGDEMDIRHTGRDIKYGRYTLSIPHVEFEPHTKIPIADPQDDEYVPSHTHSLASEKERMCFLLDRPPTRGSAVECMKRIRA